MAREIIYEYDDNGSVTKRTTKPINESYPTETVWYSYDTANRLTKVITGRDAPQDYTEYKYNEDGIRVRVYTYNILPGDEEPIVANQKTVVYLPDSYNHTGYTQTLEELKYYGADPDVTVNTPYYVRTYLIGDDVIAQTTEYPQTTEYLLYDGHGSTRQLARYNNEQISIIDNYSYDGYGVFLQPDYSLTQNAVRTLPQQTSLLYAGEHFDFNSQQYYNRARWYNPLSGLFNQMDPYSGNTSDPQSLHKYLYCHANPVNGIDPSGNMGWFGWTITIVITLAVLYHAAYKPFFRPLIMMAWAEPIDSEILTKAIGEMRQYWWKNQGQYLIKTKMNSLAGWIEESERIGLGCRVKTINSDEDEITGLNFRASPYIYLSRQVVENRNALELSIVIFAEYQHHSMGGGLGEQEAMDEFVIMRRQIPIHLRTDWINRRCHGGVQNIQ